MNISFDWDTMANIIGIAGFGLALFEVVYNFLSRRLQLAVHPERFSCYPEENCPPAEQGKWDVFILGLILFNESSRPLAVSGASFWYEGCTYYAYMPRKRLVVGADKPFEPLGEQYDDFMFDYQIFSTELPINIDAYSAAHVLLAFSIPVGIFGSLPCSILLKLRTNKGITADDIVLSEDDLRAAADWLTPLHLTEDPERRNVLIRRIGFNNVDSGNWH